MIFWLSDLVSWTCTNVLIVIVLIGHVLMTVHHDVFLYIVTTQLIFVVKMRKIPCRTIVSMVCPQKMIVLFKRKLKVAHLRLKVYLRNLNVNNVDVYNVVNCFMAVGPIVRIVMMLPSSNTVNLRLNSLNQTFRCFPIRPLQGVEESINLTLWVLCNWMPHLTLISLVSN